VKREEDQPAAATVAPSAAIATRSVSTPSLTEEQQRIKIWNEKGQQMLQSWDGDKISEINSILETMVKKITDALQIVGYVLDKSVTKIVATLDSWTASKKIAWNS
jgi:hypothetical protein